MSTKASNQPDKSPCSSVAHLWVFPSVKSSVDTVQGQEVCLASLDRVIRDKYSTIQGWRLDFPPQFNMWNSTTYWSTWRKKYFSASHTAENKELCQLTRMSENLHICAKIMNGESNCNLSMNGWLAVHRQATCVGGENFQIGLIIFAHP